MSPGYSGLGVSPLKIDARIAGWASYPRAANGETTPSSGEKSGKQERSLSAKKEDRNKCNARSQPHKGQILRPK